MAAHLHPGSRRPLLSGVPSMDGISVVVFNFLLEASCMPPDVPVSLAFAHMLTQLSWVHFTPRLAFYLLFHSALVSALETLLTLGWHSDHLLSHIQSLSLTLIPAKIFLF